MKINKTEVEHVGRLARLAISEGEKESFSDQLSQILKFMDQLGSVETQGVPQTASVIDQTNGFRDDIPQPCLSAETATNNAPQTDGEFFIVPKILTER